MKHGVRTRSVYTATDQITFSTTFTNGNTNGLQLRLAPLAGLTDAGGVVNLDLNNNRMAECYNCNPFRLFVSGQMVAGAEVPEPSTLTLALLPLALGIMWRRTRGARR